TPVLDAAARHLDAAAVLDRVLPDRAGVLYAAGLHLYPDGQREAERRPFFERALAVLEAEPAPAAAGLRLRGPLCRAPGRPDEAAAALAAALRREPGKADWHFELAGVLAEQGRLDQAREELEILLGRHPGHSPARELLRAVAQAAKKQGLSGGR